MSESSIQLLCQAIYMRLPCKHRGGSKSIPSLSWKPDVTGIGSGEAIRDPVRNAVRVAYEWPGRTYS